MRFVFVAILLTVAVGSTARAEGVVRLRLDPAAATVDVELDLPINTRTAPAFITLPFAPQRFAREGGLEQFVKLLDDAGHEQPWTGRIDKPGTKLHLRYRVALQHVAAQPAAGPDEVPHATSTGWSLLARALIPLIRAPNGQPIDAAINVELEAVTTPTAPNTKRWASALGDGPKLHAPSLEALRDTVLYWGTFVDETLDLPQLPIRLVSSDFDTAQLGGIRSLIRRAATLAIARFGKPSEPRLLVIVDRSTDTVGSLSGNTLTLLVPTPPSPLVGELPGRFALGELLRVWLHAEESWLEDSLVRYYELVFTMLLDKLDPTVAAAQLTQLFTPLLDRNNRDQSIAHADGPWLYAAGTLMALMIDTTLRNQHHGSLDELIAKTHPLAFAPLQAALTANDAALADRLKLLVQKHPLAAADFIQSARDAGFEANVTMLRQLSPKTIGVKILRVASSIDDASRVRIGTPLLGSPFRSGDSVFACQQHPIANLAALQAILGALPDGATLSCDIMREGLKTTVRWNPPLLTDADGPRIEGVTITSTTTSPSWPSHDGL